MNVRRGGLFSPNQGLVKNQPSATHEQPTDFTLKKGKQPRATHPVTHPNNPPTTHPATHPEDRSGRRIVTAEVAAA